MTLIPSVCALQRLTGLFDQAHLVPASVQRAQGTGAGISQGFGGVVVGGAWWSECSVLGPARGPM